MKHYHDNHLFLNSHIVEGEAVMLNNEGQTEANNNCEDDDNVFDDIFDDIVEHHAETSSKPRKPSNHKDQFQP